MEKPWSNAKTEVYKMAYQGVVIAAWSDFSDYSLWRAVVIDPDDLIAFETMQSEYGKAVGVAKRWQKRNGKVGP